MTNQEINIANALIAAKEALTEMILQGLSNPKNIFALSNVLSEKFSLTKDQAIIVIENALKIV